MRRLMNAKQAPVGATPSARCSVRCCEKQFDVSGRRCCPEAWQEQLMLTDATLAANKKGVPRATG